MSIFETLSHSLKTSNEEEKTLQHIQSIDKQELRGLDNVGNSLLFVALEV